MPRRKRPGASDSIASACCAITIGWRGHVWMMQVPMSTRSVWTPAAANAAMGSCPPDMPMVPHVAGMPARSASAICSTAARALPA